MTERATRTVKSVEKACAIMDRLRERRGCTVSELTETIDLSAGTIHTHLATLKQQGFVVQHGDAYKLGPELLTMGEYVRNHDDLYQASKNQVEQLARESEECAHLIFEHGGRLYALYERFGTQAVGIEFHDRKREEALSHLHCTAAGKAILAHLPADRVREITENSGLPTRTPKTITDFDTLKSALEDVREDGVAHADEEQILGIRAVGAPILDQNEQVVGAIALSGPTSRLNGERFSAELPQAVKQAANICEVNLQTTHLEEEI